MANVSLYRPLNDLQREVERVFDRFIPDLNERDQQSVWSPLVDVHETEEAYVVHMDLPGVMKEDVSITFENGTLNVSGERKMWQNGEKPQFHRIERWNGRFFRSFQLGQAVNADGIKAAFDNGVLRIEVPKAEESKPRRIAIS